jgi:hypothetical protein
MSSEVTTGRSEDLGVRPLARTASSAEDELAGQSMAAAGCPGEQVRAASWITSVTALER